LSPGGCFSIAVPDQAFYNIGNTTMNVTTGGGSKWCIDHNSGYIYNQIIDKNGAQYYEVDDVLAPPGSGIQCRFLVGLDPDSGSFTAKVYKEAGLTCTLTSQGTVSTGVTAYKLDVTQPPRK
jgi:hypothetical protein